MSNIILSKRKSSLALAGVTQWIGHRPATHTRFLVRAHALVADWSPGGGRRKAAHPWIDVSLTWTFLSLHPFSFL